MSQQFARLLKDHKQIIEFITISLGLNIDDYPDIEYEITKSEKGTIDGLQNPTSSSDRYRDRHYTSDSQRLDLRKQIVDELFNLELLDEDDEITLGAGGAKPKKIVKGKQAFFLTGLPASGKSSVASRIAKKYNAIILDSDFAKRKLPEYAKYPWGASLVHAESSMIIFGNESKTGFTSLYSKAVEAEYNIVIPKVGAEPDDILPYMEALKSAGYTVHLTLVYLPKEKSTARALKRFSNTKRYVPLSTIFDVYGNNPALTYFMLKNKQLPWIDTYGIINTDFPMGAASVCTDIQNKPPFKNPAIIYKLDKNALI